MALALGVFLPIAETVRRIKQIIHFEEFFNWFDDYLLGALLCWSAYRVMSKKNNSLAHLIAAWGIAAGGVTVSFLSQLTGNLSGKVDPGIFNTTLVAIVKGLILLYIVIGLTKAISASDVPEKKE